MTTPDSLATPLWEWIGRHITIHTPTASITGWLADIHPTEISLTDATLNPANGQMVHAGQSRMIINRRQIVAAHHTNR